MGDDRIDLIWSSKQLGSTEHFALRERPDGATLSGATVLVTDGLPSHATYRIEVDETWRTIRAAADVVSARDQSYRIEVADAEWTIDGERRPDLDGCLDIDLGWTPATNLLPIRRLDLELGEIGRIDAAWLRYPELDIVRNAQAYERVGEDDYVYRSGEVEYSMRTTSDGVVTRYGDDLWFATSLVRT